MFKMTKGIEPNDATDPILRQNKFALLWGEAQKKIIPIVTLR